MRPDMNKVVTERPRSGSGYNNNNKNDVTATRQRWRGQGVARLVADTCDEDLWAPQHSAAFTENRVQRTPWDTKSFSDVLGPLKGYLHKQIGKRWDDVYAELSRHLDKRGTAGSHIWDHVRQEVETRHVYMGADGLPYAYRRGRWLSGGPLTNCLYVHPDTGVLCKAPGRRYQFDGTRHALWKKLRALGLVGEGWQGLVVEDWVIVDDLHVLQRQRGGWFVHVFQRFDPDEVIGVRMIGEREVPLRRKDNPKAPLIRHISTRQIGRREKTLWAVAQKKLDAVRSMP